MVLLILAVVFAGGCVFGGEDDADLSRFFPQPEEEPAPPPDDETVPRADTDRPSDLLDLSSAPRTALEAVQKFFALLEAERPQDAYRFLSLGARERSSAEEFASRYADIWDEATIQSMTWEIVPPPDPNVAGMEVILHYSSSVFGEIEERVFVPTRREPGWVVDWSAGLIFDGLEEPGTLVHRFVDVPTRGDILDRNDTPLATNGEVVVIGVSHDLIQDVDAVVTLLAERLELDEAQVRALVNQNVPSYFFIPVAQLPFGVDPDLIAEFEQLAEQGILVRREPRRVYPQGELAAQVVGFLGEITAEELEERSTDGYQPGDLVGRDGIEAIYDEVLAGRRGSRLTIIGPDGSVVREIATDEGRPPRDVRLTLDVRVQRVAEAALADQPGAVVVMDPRSNEILALASFPRFNPNAFVDGLTEEEFERYFEDPNQPFINRSVEQTYAPGSTFKIITLAAAIEGLGRHPDDRLPCPAVWTGLGPDTPLKNWKEEDQGNISLVRALAESCNSVFYELGVELDQEDQNLLPRVAAGFGLGAKTGAVGLQEEAGVDPGPDWKRVNLNDFWYTGDTVNMSIGQGFVSVTPLQIANAYAAIATDGILKTPIAVQALVGEDGAEETFAPKPINVLPVSADTLAILRGSLRSVIAQTYGTGWFAFNRSPLAAAGKSGTAEDLVAETDEEDKNHAWFTAYANYADPRAVVTVVLDDGESGADDAGPIAREVLERSILGGWIP